MHSSEGVLEGCTYDEEEDPHSIYYVVPQPVIPLVRAAAATTTSADVSRKGLVENNKHNNDMAPGKVPRYLQQFLAWLAAFATAQEPSYYTLSVPSSVPSNASAVVDPNFAGFAFEQASLWNYALDVDGNANQFSINLIAAITNRTGGIPLIRLGGTS